MTVRLCKVKEKAIGFHLVLYQVRYLRARLSLFAKSGEVILNIILSQCSTLFAGQMTGNKRSPFIQNFNDAKVNIPPS